MTVALHEHACVKSSFIFTQSTQTREQIGVTEWTVRAVRELTAIENLIRENLAHREPESEDELLVTGDLLPRLIAETRQVPPSDDWERDLYEL